MLTSVKKAYKTTKIAKKESEKTKYIPCKYIESSISSNKTREEENMVCVLMSTVLKKNYNKKKR